MSMLRRPLTAVLLAVTALLVLGPMYWLVITAFKTNREILGDQHTLFPTSPTIDNFTYLFTQSAFRDYLTNSLVVSIGSTLIALAIGTSAGYALSRFSVFGGRNDTVIFLLLVVRAVPPLLLVIPVYLALRSVHLLNTLPGLVLVYSCVSVPFVVWMMRSFFDEVPREISEAALVDGASPLRIFWSVTLPLTMPGLAATAILTIITIYNEFLFALTITSTPDAQTVPVGAATLIGRIEVQWGPLAAGGVVAMVPVLALILFLQRHLIRGLTAGAVK